ncbi:MAG TPA: alpha/beta hydrolase [Candidatus Sulfopaludibacter sp.]|nr:alpha/beta hydrolase [Candidatus Sulfopaludibacter sp.]
MKQVELHFEISGSGNVPLICTHGWACHGEQFIPLSQFLGEDFRIFRPDLPGHGRTSLDGFSPTFAHYADALVDFALAQGLTRPVLVGHSMGGVLSVMAAASGRLRPRAVINLDGSLPATEKTLTGQELIRGWLEEPDFRGRLAGFLRKVFFLPAERDARCDAILQMMCSAPEAVLRFLPEQAGELHPEHILPRVKAPVLYIGSSTPRFDVPKATALLPQLHLKQIFDAGHFLHVYAAGPVAILIRDFLKATIRG